jgi:hypothetical protein
MNLKEKVRDQIYNRIWRDVWLGFRDKVEDKLIQNVEGDF